MSEHKIVRKFNWVNKDLLKDNIYDLAAIKQEIDSNEEINVRSRKCLKHHLVMEHSGFSDDKIEEFICDLGH